MLLCAQVGEQLRDYRFILEQQPGIFLGSAPRSGAQQGKGVVEECGPGCGFRPRHFVRMAEPLEF